MSANDVVTAGALALAVASLASAAAAAPTRTFVATTGSDGNPCLLAQPCRSFGAAITQVADGGEVVVLDSGGYGKFSVAKSVTVTAPPGVYAGISVFAGDDGVTVDAPGIAVTLRGLTINGQGGNDGIRFVAGAALRVERLEITAMAQHGIEANLAGDALVLVRDTTIARNAHVGVRLTGAGRATLDRVRLAENGEAALYAFDGPEVAMRDVVAEANFEGLEFSASAAGVSATIERSRVFGGLAGFYVVATGAFVGSAVVADSEFAGGSGAVSATGSSARVSVARTQIVGNQTGVYATSGGTVYLDACVVTESTYGVIVNGSVGNDPPGKVYTRQNNLIHHNQTDVVNAMTPYAGQ